MEPLLYDEATPAQATATAAQGVPPDAPQAAIAWRRAPEPLHGGPLALLRFMRAHDMLRPSYARLLVRSPGDRAPAGRIGYAAPGM